MHLKWVNPRRRATPNCPGRPVKGTQAGLFGEEGHTPEPKNLIKPVYPFGEVASAFQKGIRRGDVRAAMYWGHLLYGDAPYYAWKRALVTAAEDVGLAAPEAVEKVCGLALAWRICREKSYFVSPHHFNMAVMLPRQPLPARALGTEARTGIRGAQTPAGRLLFHVLGAIADFEHDLIHERVIAGLQRVRAQGRRLGRPRLHHVDGAEPAHGAGAVAAGCGAGAQGPPDGRTSCAG